ncbi:MAG: hypothetical protein AAF252_04370 [Pseudomonadota bacterium]
MRWLIFIKKVLVTPKVSDTHEPRAERETSEVRAARAARVRQYERTDKLLDGILERKAGNVHTK